MKLVKRNKEEMAPVDMNHLRLFTEGDVAEERIQFELFLACADGILAELEAALTQDRPEAWHHKAHLLKGASADIGAAALYKICAIAERDFAAEAEEKEQWMDAMDNEVARIRAFLSRVHAA